MQAVNDLRGKCEPVNKINKVPIVDHINSFSPTISHYRREHAPDRKYIPSDLNIQMMYNDFKSKIKHFKCSYELYRTVIEEMNISFVKLGHEECFSCVKFSLHEKDLGHNNIPNCDDCKNYNIHIEKAGAARKCYQDDGDNPDNKSVYSADLQKVFCFII